MRKDLSKTLLSPTDCGDEERGLRHCLSWNLVEHMLCMQPAQSPVFHVQHQANTYEILHYCSGLLASMASALKCPPLGESWEQQALGGHGSC